MVKVRINEVLNKDCWVFLFYYVLFYDNGYLIFWILICFNELIFWFLVFVVVLINIWGEGYNFIVFIVYWEFVLDIWNEIKGKLGGY